jgi:hypothetical protein
MSVLSACRQAAFVHWLAYDGPVEAYDIAEGESSPAGLPHGAVEGINCLAIASLIITTPGAEALSCP